MVFDYAIGRGMTLKQYGKHMKEQSISMSDIVKCGILTKSQLERAIFEGHLSTVKIGARKYISKALIYEYLSK